MMTKTMQKWLKNSFIGLVFLGLFIALVLSYLRQPKAQNVQAEQGAKTAMTKMVCDEPIIPIGIAIDKTTELISAVQGHFDNARGILELSIQDINTVISALNENQEGVCDFRKCSADVTDKGVDASIEVQTMVTQPLSIGGHAANCKVNLATGKPCPDIAEFSEKFDQSKNASESIQQQIKDIFDKSKAQIPITDDLKQKGDSAGAKMTLPEAIIRNSDLVEALLVPSAGTGWKQTCALTLAEQKKVARDEMGNVTPVQCYKALDNNWYWPRAWSLKCQNACKDSATKACKQCLAEADPGPSGSFLAKINYKIYGVCKDVCKDELTVPCQQCICKKDDGTIMEFEGCAKFLCGGSESNWVCCHERQLEGAFGPGATGGVTGNCKSDIVCPDAGLNICGATPVDCCKAKVSSYDTDIINAASNNSICPGVDTIKLIKAIMSQESCGNPLADSGHAYGLMQLQPATAEAFKDKCGVTDKITKDWLKNPANAEAQICIAIEFLKVQPKCDCDVRHLAARYNSGMQGNLDACDQSQNCGQDASGVGGECLQCSGEPYTRRWECLWDNNTHTVCNTGFSETRKYVPKVNYCYSQF